MQKFSLYDLGKMAQNGDTIAMMKIIERKKYLIKKKNWVVK